MAPEEAARGSISANGGKRKLGRFTAEHLEKLRAAPGDQVATSSRSRRVGEVLPVYVTLADVHRMLAAAALERDRWAVELLWRTGCRVSELAAARAGDLTEGGIRLVNRKQGRRAEKHVFLAADFLDRLRAYLAGRPADAAIIGSASGRPLTPRRLRQIVHGLSLAAGVDREPRIGSPSRAAWPHTLRHGCAVHLLLNGAPITAVQRHLGHASLGATAVYTKLADPDMRRLVERVAF